MGSCPTPPEKLIWCMCVYIIGQANTEWKSEADDKLEYKKIEVRNEWKIKSEIVPHCIFISSFPITSSRSNAKRYNSVNHHYVCIAMWLIKQIIVQIKKTSRRRCEYKKKMQIERTATKNILRITHKYIIYYYSFWIHQRVCECTFCVLWHTDCWTNSAFMNWKRAFSTINRIIYIFMCVNEWILNCCCWFVPYWKKQVNGGKKPLVYALGV